MVCKRHKVWGRYRKEAALLQEGAPKIVSCRSLCCRFARHGLRPRTDNPSACGLMAPCEARPWDRFGRVRLADSVAPSIKRCRARFSLRRRVAWWPGRPPAASCPRARPCRVIPERPSDWSRGKTSLHGLLKRLSRNSSGPIRTVPVGSVRNPPFILIANGSAGNICRSFRVVPSVFGSEQRIAPQELSWLVRPLRR